MAWCLENDIEKKNLHGHMQLIILQHKQFHTFLNVFTLQCNEKQALSEWLMPPTTYFLNREYCYCLSKKICVQMEPGILRTAGSVLKPF